MTESADTHDTLRPWLALLLVAAPLLMFGRAVGYPFTNWDDLHAIVNNRRLTWSLENFAALWTPGGVSHEMLYIPVTYCSYLVDELLFQRAAAAVHAVNVLLHTVNTALVLLLCRRLGLAVAGTVVATLIFALHPVQVEPVAWAVGRKDLLSALFGVSAILLHMGPSADGDNAKWRRLALFATAALAMLAKPSMIVLPVLLLIFDWWRQGHLTRRQLTGRIELYLLALVIVGVSVVMPDEPHMNAAHDMWFRLLCVPWVGLGWLARLAGAPVSPIYGWPAVADAGMVVAGGLLFVAVAAVILVALLKTGEKGALAGLVFATVTIAPAGMIVIGGRDFITGDRYGYLAMIGIGLALGSLLRQRRRWLRIGCFLWLFFIGVQAHLQVPVWSDSELLWEAALEHAPDTPLVYNNLALTYVDKGRLDAARETLEQGLEKAPDHGIMRANYGRVLLDLGNKQRATRELLRAIELDAGNARAWKSLGDCQGKDKAIVAYRRAIELDPSYTAARQALEKRQGGDGD
ncbi:MAG: tetratricopeptide repeat protein [Lentisphaeria bacterium]|jgi:hypothetical protein|nr:tetratricopeptide repeat protein [Lentisphaeria bacterium]